MPMHELTPEVAFTNGVVWLAAVSVAGIVAWIIGGFTVYRFGSWLWKAVTG